MPIRELVVAVHPFEPSKGITLHVKSCHRESLFKGNLIELEKLVSLKKPIQWILVLEGSKLQLWWSDVRASKGGCRWGKKRGILWQRCKGLSKLGAMGKERRDGWVWKGESWGLGGRGG